MKSVVVLLLSILVFAHPPRLVEIAKRVNKIQNSWIANENTPLRDYSSYIGTLRNKKPLPIRSVQIKRELPKEFDCSVKWPECA